MCPAAPSQKTGEYIAEQLIQAINAVGPDNVIQVRAAGSCRPACCCQQSEGQLSPRLTALCVHVHSQVVTDSAANCKAAGRLVEEEFPHITWSPCVAHVCDLWLEDMFKIEYFATVYTDSKAAVTFIRCGTAALAT